MAVHNSDVCPACAARRATIERMIEQYRAAAKRRQLRRAMRVFEDAEADHALAQFDRPPHRIH